MSKVGFVLASSPGSIVVELDGLEVVEKGKRFLQPGRYLKIDDGNMNFAVAVIRNLKATHEFIQERDVWRFVLDCVPVGALIVDGDASEFRRGSPVLPVPTEAVHLMDDEITALLFASTDENPIQLGVVASNPKVPFLVNGDRLLGKHIAVVGSTGSGKSCAVSHILQNAVGISGGNYSLHGKQNNSHVVIFDLHAEYAAAFRLQGQAPFTLNELTVDELKLPYWLMSSEELEAMFIESNESNSHNQVSMFKRAVTLNKRKHNPVLAEANYDTPCFFSMVEVVNFLDNVNREVVGRLDKEGLPKLSDGSLVSDVGAYFDVRYDFITSSTAKDTKATNGPFHGEFTRFVSRLETTLSDERLRFLLDCSDGKGGVLGSEKLGDILKQFIGYSNKSNVTILDLSGVPFEVLSVTVSLISRLIFDFCFHYSKIRHVAGDLNDIPVLLVCEEAHNYLPANDAVAYRASRKSIERVAKEGRKYGLSLMVVSQRPSEVSSTIFAQCSNFIALRLTNSADQSYIKSLLPDDGNGVADFLSSMPQGEALIVGDSVIIPTVVRLPLPNPQPKSASVRVHAEWSQGWKEPLFEAVIKRWRREGT